MIDTQARSRRWDIYYECVRMKHEVGRVNYSEVARRMNITRSAVSKTLKQMRESKMISEAQLAEITSTRPVTPGPKVTREVKLTEVNDRFVQNLAAAFKVYPEVIVNSALDAFRKQQLQHSEGALAAAPPGQQS